MNFWKILIITILITKGAVSGFSQTEKKLDIAFQPADNSNVSIFIVLKDLPGQYFLFTVPEIFLAENFEKGIFNADLTPWRIKGNTAFRKVRKNQLTYWVNMSLHQKNNIYWLEWTINFQNKSKDTIRNLSAFNCLSMNYAPLFKDTSLTRTWVENPDGKTVSLKSVQKTTGEGRRTMQFYPSVNGIKDLSTIPWLRDWQVISPQKLGGNKMWLYSKDNRWQIETLTDGKGQPAFFFNNWEGDHGCIHSSPLIAETLGPGKTATASGKFKFIKRF